MDDGLGALKAVAPALEHKIDARSVRLGVDVVQAQEGAAALLASVPGRPRRCSHREDLSDDIAPIADREALTLRSDDTAERARFVAKIGRALRDR